MSIGANAPASTAASETDALGHKTGSMLGVDRSESSLEKCTPSVLEASPMHAPAPYNMRNSPLGKIATLGAWGAVVSQVTLASGVRTGPDCLVNAKPSLDSAKPIPP